MNFTKEIKRVQEPGKRFDFGPHQVKITSIDLDETDTGKEFIEVAVEGPNGEEDKARVWFTSEKGANYSFNVLRQIYVHNAPQTQKEKAGSSVDKTTNTEELADLMQKCVNGECWFEVYPDKERTYTDNQGVERQSLNKNILGYEPRLKTDLLPKEQQTQLLLNEADKVPVEDVPFKSPSDAPVSSSDDKEGSEKQPSSGSSTIPSSW